ncbi:MAG: hypothetical protein K0S44_29 [Bacteroidetes bacterium]|jgi:hypothetical protein|nr:hypothetical protein [Bacteroidota bacterium]
MRITKEPAKKTTARYSLIVMIAIVGWLSATSFNKTENPMSWDLFGYYLYSPAIIIWDDPALKDFSKVEETNAKYHNTPSFYQGSKTENGSWMIKYTLGSALMELPFFMTAHFIAPSLGYEQDGFSEPYQQAMILCHFFYLIVGVVFLRKVVLKFFSDKITAFLLVLILLGTNYYITSGGVSIHTMEFSLFSIILYLTIRWHEDPKRSLAILLGLCVGLSIIVRPTDGLIALIPILWNVTSVKTFKEKIKFYFSNYKFQLLLIIVFCFAIVFLQMWYWKTVNDTWLIMSYNNNAGEGFEFLQPYLLEVLFSFRKGWFIYTPLMILATIGFIQMYKKNKKIFYAVFIFFLLNVYVVSSWSCWWYAGCYGQRAMVESYAVLILPLGYFIEGTLSSQKAIVRWGSLILILLLLGLNIFQSWQYDNGILHGDRMTRSYYFKIFGKTKVEDEHKKLLLVDRSQGGIEHFSQEGDYNKRLLFMDDFETIEGNKDQYVDSVLRNGKFSIKVDSNFIFTRNNELPYNLITRKDHAWIRTSFWYYTRANLLDNRLGLVVTFTNKKGEAYKYSVVDIGTQAGDQASPGQWIKYTVDYLTPEVRDENDKLNIYFWLRGKQPVYIDDFKVEAYERKEAGK